MGGGVGKCAGEVTGCGNYSVGEVWESVTEGWGCEKVFGEVWKRVLKCR